MKVILVYLDTQDSMTANTKHLVAVAADSAASVRYIMSMERCDEDTAERLIAQKIYRLVETEVCQ